MPRPFLERMEKGNPEDPLLLQVLPRALEKRQVSGYVDDPLLEAESLKGNGIIQKYQGRILIIATGVCAINCRYCFRRHFSYSDCQFARDNWPQVLEYIRNDPTIREVILSGGDPLVMSDDLLAHFVESLSQVQQVTHLRIHTRLPVVIPQRVHAPMLEWITGTRLRVVFVLHANHANEVDHHVEGAVERLRSVGVPVLNQSVLLQGINSSCDDLCSLSWRLSEIGVIPYYLHLLDKVAGAAHFEVPSRHALALLREMRTRLPGYLVPRLVSEIPGQRSKHDIL